MKALRIPLRAVLYKEEGRWIAHCLEFDLIGDGADQREALVTLTKAIAIQVKASIKYNNPRNLFAPADGRFFEMYAAGRDIAVGELNVAKKVKLVEIEELETREYSGSVESDVDLVPT